MWFATIGLAIVAAVASGFAPAPAILLFAVVVVVAASVLRPGFALGAVVFSALIMSGLQTAITLPTQASLLTRVFIAVFALSTMLRLRRGMRVSAHLTPFIIWAGILAVSTMVAVSDRILSLQGFWTYLCGPVAFLAILYSDLCESTLKKLSLAIAGLMALQLPVVLYQNLFVATKVDEIGGTFGKVGGTSLQAIIMGFTWTVAIALLAGKRRVWLVPIAAAVVTVLLVSEAKAGFLFCAIGTVAAGLAIGVLTRRFATVSIKYTAIAAGAVAALFAGYAYAGSVLKGGERGAINLLASMSTSGAVVRYLFSHGPQGQAGRLEGVRLALMQGRSALADALIGRGPGLLSSSTLLGGTSAFLAATGATFEWATSLTRSILETGILGTLTYAVVVAAAVWTVSDSWKPRVGELGTAVVAACVGLAAVYLVAGVYASAWHSDAVAVTFWCVMGIAAKWGQVRRAAAMASSPVEETSATAAV